VADPGRESLSGSERKRLESAYLATTYRVEAQRGSIDLRVGQHCAALDRLLQRCEAKTWAFVSATNPRSMPMPAWRNRDHHLKLVQAVRAAGYPLLEGAGLPADTHWDPEPGLLIIGISRDAAGELGKRFGQLAILVGCRGGMPELLWCDGSSDAT